MIQFVLMFLAIASKVAFRLSGVVFGFRLAAKALSMSATLSVVISAIVVTP
jgi:hypothetical protein